VNVLAKVAAARRRHLREPIDRVRDGFADRADAFDAVICNAAAAARGFEVLARWSSVDRLGEVRCPTLISVGRSR